MFRKLSRDMGDIKKTQIKLLQLKTMMSEIKIILARINSVLEIAEEKNSKHKDIKIGTTPNETHREKIIL